MQFYLTLVTLPYAADSASIHLWRLDWFELCALYNSDVAFYETVVYVTIFMSDVMLSTVHAYCRIIFQIAVLVALSAIKPNHPIWTRIVSGFTFDLDIEALNFMPFTWKLLTSSLLCKRILYINITFTVSEISFKLARKMKHPKI
jgi:hypothetical protein